VLLQVSPDIFCRVEFRGVCGQVEGFYLAFQGRYILLHETTTMPWEPIPNQQNGAVDLFVQVAKEVQDLFLPHAPLVRPKVELPQSHPCSDGEVIPIELVLQDGRNAALGPCAHPMRSLAEAAFVYEDDDPALFLGFFLRAGQMFSFQSRMAASFRSRARPTGRWQLQPSFWRKIHHTWPE
jgi:hypothetical protein